MHSLRRSPATIFSSVAFLGIGCLGSVGARAADTNLLTNPFYLSLGTFTVNSDTKVELDGEGQIGTPINFEKTFGDENATRIRLDGYWRFADRHKVRFMSFSSRVENTRTLDEEITWGDETFPIDASVTAENKFAIYEVAYEYAFMRREKFELTASAGLHWTSLTLKLTNNEGASSVSDEGSLDLPLPVFGLRGLWNPYGDFWIDGSAQVFSLSYDAYDGHLSDYRLAALWQPKKWLGVGLGYNVFKVDVDADKERFRGSLNWQYDGPQVFISGTF